MTVHVAAVSSSRVIAACQYQHDDDDDGRRRAKRRGIRFTVVAVNKKREELNDYLSFLYAVSELSINPPRQTKKQQPRND